MAAKIRQYTFLRKFFPQRCSRYNFLYIAKIFPMKLFYFLALLCSLQSIAQKDINPTPEDIEKAKTLRAAYPKSDVAILTSSQTINFGVDKNGTNVTVKDHVEELLMGINHRADIKKYEFYDSQSEVKTLSLKYRNGKTAPFLVADEFYKDKDLFYNDARVKHMSVDFPVQGYTYNYEMDKNYQDVKYLTSLYFNEEFPVIDKKISVTIPDWLEVDLKEFNFQGQNIVKSQVRDEKKGVTTYTYSMSNVPPVFDEENSPGRSYLYPHLLVITKSFKHKDKQTALFGSASDLYKWYKSLTDMMSDDTAVLQAKVEELTANAKTDEEKIKKIYYWVQDNIRYIAFEDGIAGFKPDESNHVFTKRYGDCKGMANLTAEMLKIAGFDARLTWIGTKHIAYDYTSPSLAVDNHMICTLMFKGKQYFLDGTEKFNSFGEYAERIQNKEVMIEDGDKYIITKIPSTQSENNKDIYTANLSIVDEKLQGQCSKSSIGESRARFLYIYNSFESDKKKQALERYLSKSDKNISVHDIKTSDLSNRDQQLTIDYGISIGNKVSSFDDEIYVDLEYMNEYKNMDFAERKTDYEFDYKNDYHSNITLAIPEGFSVKKVPDNLQVSKEGYDINITFENTGKAIIYKKSFKFKNGVIKSAEMAEWTAFQKQLTSLYNQQIVLSKS